MWKTAARERGYGAGGAYPLSRVYAPGAGEWGFPRMRFLRRLVRHGNSMHVSFPPQLINWLQWDSRRGLIVEATLDREVRVRLARPEDLDAAQMPMTLDNSTPGSPR